MATISTRAAVAVFHLALIELLESAGVTDQVDINDVSVNVAYKAGRIDVVKLTPDGLHIEQALCAFAIDPHDLPTFGRAVARLGDAGGTQH